MEANNNKLKIFISYSHMDESYVKDFIKHIAPLEKKGLVEIWYDRKILPGEDFQKKIDCNLEDADIICLFVSSNFLSSAACEEEKKRAIELKKEKGIYVVSIILSHCGWLDDKDISKPLVLPTDGKPIASFSNRDEGWYDVYINLKKIIEEAMKIRSLELREEFREFLRDTEILETAHSQKEKVFLDDIFIYPELDKYSDLKEFEEKISSEELIQNIFNYPKITIAGESQSGKTTLCKIIFRELRKKNFIPVYISNKKSHYRGSIKKKIRDLLCEQYHIENIEKFFEMEIVDRIIPILDDFHFAKNKDKHIKELSFYPRCILIVDDIFSLNIKDEKLLGDFSYFQLCEFKPSLRYNLVKKWVTLRDMDIIDSYREIDKKIELIDFILGKIIGRGIMPSYPFFILSAIVTYETFNIPLNQEITSQGYCYQAFIYLYLKKQGVKEDEIDIYINFLTELAFYIYKKREYELSLESFNLFIKSYLKKYTLPIKQDNLMKNLSMIILRDSFNNYSFRYPYLYYFFVAKYLAEHIENSNMMKKTKKIIQNLHVEENAYIAVFLTYHSKNPKILDELIYNTQCLFDKYKPSTLSRNEVKFIDDQAEIIIKAVLPSTSMPEKNRAKVWEIKDKVEQAKERMEQKEGYDPLEKELRRAIKTVEVMGCIIKSRVGSLEKVRIIDIFKEGMNLHLRILSCLFEFIESEKGQRDIIEFISSRLDKIESQKENKKSNDEKIKKIARNIFWNLNFLAICGIIFKIIHSLGSDKLYEIIEKIDKDVNTPASFLVKHGILMWYNKNLQLTNLAKRIKGKDFSETARNIVKFMVVHYCSLHPISYKDRQRIERMLKIPRKKLPIIPNDIN